MADCLVYWQRYWNDYKREGEEAITPDWYTEKKYFRDQIKRGNNRNLWVVVSGGEDDHNEWRLIQRIYVDKVEKSGTNSKEWHAKGDVKKSKVFDINDQSDFAPTLHKLSFASNNPITATGTKIGQSLQEIRPLSNSDVALLNQYAKTLKTKRGISPNKPEKDNSNQEPLASSTGAGFGETEKNLQVEKDSVSFVTRWYGKQGWSVQPVEQQKRGFDLICSKGSKEEHVEVKGISGNVCSFIITAGEVQQAKSNAKFVICIVTEALSKTPKLSRYTGKDFLQQYTLEALQYKAVMKSP